MKLQEHDAMQFAQAIYEKMHLNDQDMAFIYDLLSTDEEKAQWKMALNHWLDERFRQNRFVSVIWLGNMHGPFFTFFKEGGTSSAFSIPSHIKHPDDLRIKIRCGGGGTENIFTFNDQMFKINRQKEIIAAREAAKEDL